METLDCTSLLMELSLEHSEFPLEELRALSALMRCTPTYENAADGIAVVECRGEDTASFFCRRLAFTHSVSVLKGTYSSAEDMLEGSHALRETVLGRTFRIRASTRLRHMKEETRELERELGRRLSEHGRVDLERADVEIRVYALMDRFFVAALSCRPDRKSLDSRSVSNRPFFSPVSLPPRYALGLVNLCGISEGERVLDPFCGTGGILIEAAMAGAVITGSDMDGRMIDGTRENLERLGIKGQYRLLRCDVSEIAGLGEFDAVLTDPPYGRSSSTGGESVKSLYGRAFGAISDSLAEGGRLGIVVPDVSLVPRVQGLKLQKTITQKVHRSLTRNFLVFRKDRS
jgi:tRNA (guanine10-N2)-dimethyltransferase